MNPDLVYGKCNLAEKFCQNAACREPLTASHLHLLDGKPSPDTGSDHPDSTNAQCHLETDQAEANRQSEPADIVQQIHDARAVFGKMTSCSLVGDHGGTPDCSVHPTSMEVFVEGTAHHFNNLFMAIQGYASLLQFQLEPSDPAMTQLQRIESLVHGESILTNDLLRFLIGRPYRISNQDQSRLVRQICMISGSIGETNGIDQNSSRLHASWCPPEQMLRSLSGSIACIIGRLLSEIQEQAAAAADQLNTDAKALERLQQIDGLTRKGLRLVCQLLGYAGHTALPNGHRIARDKLIEAVQQTFSGRKGPIRLFVDVDADLPKIKLRHGQLMEILMEVLDNAAEAMSKGGDLFFAAAKMRPEEIDEPGWKVPARQFIRLTVRDSGHGFDPLFGRLIFDPFFTNKGREGHHGLGLSNIYGMVDAVGGYIGVQTEQGSGSIFHIYLPAEKAGESTISVPGAWTSGTAGRRDIHPGHGRRRPLDGSWVLENT